MNCPHCSVSIPTDAAFCPQCGGSIGDATESRRADEPRPTASPSLATKTSRDGGDEEVEIWRGGYSGKAMVNYWVVAVLATIGLPIVAAVLGLDSMGWLVLGAILAIMWLGLLGILAYHKLNVRYELTNQRFIHKSGILTRHTNRIEVIDFDDVSYRQGIIERFLGVGTIEIESSDRSDPTLVLSGIDNVQAVATLMDDARRDERLRRGLHIEAV